MTVAELASRAGVDAVWLAAFEAGERTDELTYELLLRLVRATQQPRPDWWDEGHEHDLHLGTAARARYDSATDDYWQRIEAVRASSRCRPSSD